jgi:hypothetical protein
VAVVRGIFSPNRIVGTVQRIVEPELDMKRPGRKQLGAVHTVRELVRKLVPAGQRAVRSPMRSIARELEEAWPSREL